MDRETLDTLADELFERFEDRLQKSAKHGRNDKGTGSPVLGAIIRKYRGEASLRQTGNAAGLHHGFIGRAERGERGLSVESLTRLTLVFGIDFLHDYITAVAATLYPDGYRPTPLAGQSPDQNGALASTGNTGLHGLARVYGYEEPVDENAVRRWNIQQENALRNYTTVHIPNPR